MSQTIQRKIEHFKQDRNFLEQYIHHVDSLSASVIEIMVEDPRLLLSPVFRSLIAEQAKRVIAMHQEIKSHLCVDNYQSPLQADGIYVEGPADYEIIVNGRKGFTEKHELSYIDIVSLEFGGELPAGVVWSITYHGADGERHDGILSPGGKVKIKDGTIFNVANTSNA
jgi:hypothetical protein